MSTVQGIFHFARIFKGPIQQRFGCFNLIIFDAYESYSYEIELQSILN